MSESPRRDRRIWPDPRTEADEEIAFHLDMRERDFREHGLSPVAARDAARRRFGSISGISTEVRAIDDEWARRQRRSGMWSDVRQDVTYAIRTLRRSPGFAAVAILTLALGIGANTAIFSVINTALLRPLPYADDERLVFIWNERTGEPETLGPGRLVDIRSQTTSFSSVAGISHISYTLTGIGDAERLQGSSVASSFFDTLGVRPLLGGRSDLRPVGPPLRGSSGARSRSTASLFRYSRLCRATSSGRPSPRVQAHRPDRSCGCPQEPVRSRAPPWTRCAT